MIETKDENQHYVVFIYTPQRKQENDATRLLNKKITRLEMEIENTFFIFTSTPF
jgi:hypothetical protein